MGSRLGCVCGLVACMLLPPRGGVAQSDLGDDRPDVYAHLGDLALNGLVGGVIAGVRRELRGGAFRSAFLDGILGGGLSYGGKWIASREFDGAGLLGRELAAVGHSVIRNAGAGEPRLGRISFPLWFTRLEWDRGEGRVRPGVQWSELTALAWAISNEHLQVNGAQSLSAGAMVFDAPRRLIRVNGEPIDGFELEGVIALSAVRLQSYGENLAHERAHVLQGDLMQSTIGDPLETWMARRLGVAWVRALGPIGALIPLGWGPINGVVFGEPGSGPFEKEARLLAGHR